MGARVHLIAGRVRPAGARSGSSRMDLYQLHAPTAYTAVASVRALASLKRDGRIERHRSLQRERRTDRGGQAASSTSDAVQVELSVWHDDNVFSGVAEYCVTRRYPAHRAPAPRRTATCASDADASAPARSGGAPRSHTVRDRAGMAAGLSDLILPIPGPTRVETARSLARPYQVRLTEDLARLRDEFPGSAFGSQASTFRGRTSDVPTS